MAGAAIVSRQRAAAAIARATAPEADTMAGPAMHIPSRGLVRVPAPVLVMFIAAMYMPVPARVVLTAAGVHVQVARTPAEGVPAVAVPITDNRPQHGERYRFASRSCYRITQT